MTDFDLFGPQAAEVRLERMQLEKLGVTAHEVDLISDMLRGAMTAERKVNGTTSPVYYSLWSAFSGLDNARKLTKFREHEATARPSRTTT